MRKKTKVHLVIDEAASLEHFPQLSDAVDKIRAYGGKCHFFFQSMGQLKTCFPDGGDQTLLANTVQTFFAANDYPEADYISMRCGEATIIVRSGGVSRGGSSQASSQNGQSSTTTSWNSSDNWQQSGRRLLKTEEILALSERVAITFVPGLPPVCTTLTRYYETPWPLREWIGRRVRALGLSLLLAFLVSIIAASLLNQRQYFPSRPPERPTFVPVTPYDER